MVTRAWAPAGVEPLEVWDAALAGTSRRSLFDARAEATFFEHLASVVLALREGRAARVEAGLEAREERLAPCPWDSVALVGGGVDRVRAARAFEASGIPLALVDDDAFFAVTAARAWLGPDDVAIDAGQTAIKAAGPSGRVRRERRHDDGGGALAGEIAAAARAASGPAGPRRLLLALPCAIRVDAGSGRVHLGPSTYATEGDAEPLVRAVARAARGQGPLRVDVVNDAVLAAHAVRARAGAARRVLVLTIGFGVGAALVRGEERAS